MGRLVIFEDQTIWQSFALITATFSMRKVVNHSILQINLGIFQTVIFCPTIFRFKVSKAFSCARHDFVCGSHWSSNGKQLAFINVTKVCEICTLFIIQARFLAFLFVLYVTFIVLDCWKNNPINKTMPWDITLKEDSIEVIVLPNNIFLRTYTYWKYRRNQLNGTV